MSEYSDLKRRFKYTVTPGSGPFTYFTDSYRVTDAGTVILNGAMSLIHFDGCSSPSVRWKHEVVLRQRAVDVEARDLAHGPHGTECAVCAEEQEAA